VVVLAAAFALQPSRELLYGPGFTVVAVAAAALIAGVLEPGWWLHRVLSLRPVRALGRVSYGVYLWHFPVFLGVVHAWPDAPAPATVAGAIAGTAVAVIASWVLVERPVLGWSQGSRARRAAAVVPVAAAAASV
jgi:peptidoglycan/LPS O-acetylase OafA/YrhL